MVGELLISLSSGILGFFLGTQVTEAVLFVPYWKALKADDFFKLHQTYGKKIHQFYAPITILATFIPLITVGYTIINQTEHHLLLVLMGLFTLAFFLTYFLYFKRANKSFAKRSISDEALSNELKRWGNWHWGRICFECLAFACSLLLVLSL